MTKQPSIGEQISSLASDLENLQGNISDEQREALRKSVDLLRTQIHFYDEASIRKSLEDYDDPDGLARKWKSMTSRQLAVSVWSDLSWIADNAYMSDDPGFLPSAERLLHHFSCHVNDVFEEAPEVMRDLLGYFAKNCSFSVQYLTEHDDEENRRLLQHYIRLGEIISKAGY